jgi:hypothetical protein
MLSLDDAGKRRPLLLNPLMPWPIQTIIGDGPPMRV